MVRVKASELKKGIETVLCKGKWAVGQGVKNQIIGNEIVIDTDDDNMNIYNANGGTFVWYKMSYQGDTIPRLTVEADKLNKYIRSGGIVTLSNNNGILTISRTTGSSAKMPILDRHPHLESILRTKLSLSDDFEKKEGMVISNKTTLRTVIQLDSSKFCEALKLCESVNSGIYTINIDKGNLTISSEKDREMYSESISVEHNSNATVRYTGPFHKFFKGTLKIATNDNNPVLFKTDNIIILRAPRLEA